MKYLKYLICLPVVKYHELRERLFRRIPGARDVYDTIVLQFSNQKPPESTLYAPRFMPWKADPTFVDLYEKIRHRTLISEASLWILYSLARQALNLTGNFYECGVYKGGSAFLLAQLIRDSGRDAFLRLFDTFSGMPDGDPGLDWHKRGDLADTTLEDTRAFVGSDAFIDYRKGFLPDTFPNDDRIAFAHIDVDLYSSVTACADWIYPRMVKGGVMVFDDYGFPGCRGARAAVDDFFAGKAEVPIVLSSGSALVFKL